MTVRIVNDSGQRDDVWRCDVCRRVVHQQYTIQVDLQRMSVGMPMHADDDTDLCEVPQ